MREGKWLCTPVSAPQCCLESPSLSWSCQTWLTPTCVVTDHYQETLRTTQLLAGVKYYTNHCFKTFYKLIETHQSKGRSHKQQNTSLSLTIWSLTALEICDYWAEEHCNCKHTQLISPPPPVSSCSCTCRSGGGRCRCRLGCGRGVL